MTSRKQYQKDKEIRELYRQDQNTKDPYSEFKSKLKKIRSGY